MTDFTVPPIPPRIRTRVGFAQFPTGGPIALTSCRTDKLEVSVAGTVSFETRDQLNDFIHLMSALENGREGRSRVLNAADRWGTKQEINNGNWLFSGHLKYGAYTDRQRRVELELSINPTRYAEHCHRAFSPRSVEALGAIRPAELLRRRPDIKAAIARDTLGGNDNVLSHTPWATVVSQQWPDFVMQYIDAVCRLVEEDFNVAASDHCTINPPILRFHSLGSAPPQIGMIEQHVDFLVRDARQAYRQFKEHLWDAASSIADTTRLPDQTEGREVAAHWTTVSLKKHVDLKVYAKAEGRLRVEVVYLGPSAHGRPISRLLTPGYWPTNSNFPDQLAAVQRDAVDRIQRVVSYVAQQQAPAPQEPAETLVQLIATLASARLTTSAAQGILRDLLEHGAVGGPKGSPLLRVAEALEGCQLLERITIVPRTPHHRFRPTGVLRSLIERLRQQ